MNNELDNCFWQAMLQVVPTNNFEIYAYFNDVFVRLFDVKPLLKLNIVFETLKDLEVFKAKLAIINDTVTWDMSEERDPCKCIDLEFFVIFEQPPVADLLGSVENA